MPKESHLLARAKRLRAAPPAPAPPTGDAGADRRARRREQKAAKRAKLLASTTQAGGLAAIVTPQAAVAHPFESLPEDAAETPFESYRDVEPLLFRLATALGKTKATLKIYDPFYAAGSVVTHLGRLGFTDVYNRNEDAYAVAREGRTPPFDVLVTNPPFSGDHMKRCLDLALAARRPFLLLLPEFVEGKKYYARYADAAAAAGAAAAAAAPGDGFALTRPVYLGPSVRPYQFSAPGRDLDGVKPFVERTHYSELPFQVFACKFQTVWYIQLGCHRDALVAWYRKKYEGTVPCALSETTAAALPQLSKAAKAKAAAAAAGGGGEVAAEAAAARSDVASCGAAAGGGATRSAVPAAAAAAAAAAPAADGTGSSSAGSSGRRKRPLDTVVGRVAGLGEQCEEQEGGVDAEEPPAGGAGDGGMSRNAWRKKQSRQRKAAAKAALDAARARGGAQGDARGHGGEGAADPDAKKRRF